MSVLQVYLISKYFCCCTYVATLSSTEAFELLELSYIICYWCMIKEVQIVYRLFLVNCYLLHVPRLPSQPASSGRGWVIEKNWLELAWKYIAMTRNNLSIIWIFLPVTWESFTFPCVLLLFLLLKVKFFLATGFEFVYAITSLYFSNHLNHLGCTVQKCSYIKRQ